jgi:hypothetical protein
MLPSWVVHDAAAPVCFISNGGSMWPRHGDEVVDGSAMPIELPEEGSSSAHKSSPCNGLAAAARVHEPAMTTMRTKNMGTTSFLIIMDMDRQLDTYSNFTIYKHAVFVL